MIRKYNNQKVKPGDWVYIRDVSFGYDSICKYKVLALKEGNGIIVEVKDNEEDSSIISGWLVDSRMTIKMEYNLPGRTKAWFVYLWEKAGGKCLNIE